MKKFERVAVAAVFAVAMGISVSSAQSALPAPGHTFGGSTPWLMFVCPGGIVTAAVAKNAKRHRELTTPEAWTCGFLYWWNEATGQYGRP
jgi:hypothetical protein